MKLNPEEKQRLKETVYTHCLMHLHLPELEAQDHASVIVHEIENNLLTFSEGIAKNNPEELNVRHTGHEPTDQTNDAIARADAHAQEYWKKCYDQSVYAICVTQLTFVPDDVMKYMKANFPDAETHDLRAAGAGMQRAARAGWCKNTNTVRSSENPEHHKMRKTVWESLVYAK